MEFNADNIQIHLPFYLTSDDQQTLIRELKEFTSNKQLNFTLSSYNDDVASAVLQGDGWRGFSIFDFETGQRKSIRGVVLSNSCDVDPENLRDVPMRIIFAPLVKLSAFENLLKKSGIEPDRVKAKIDSIKQQKTTNIFYIPAGGTLTEDYLVRFDEAHSMPVKAHYASSNKEKIFTLNMIGFYLFVMKLSVHFCRLQERVVRKPLSLIA